MIWFLAFLALLAFNVLVAAALIFKPWRTRRQLDLIFEITDDEGGA